ncbi:MAG: NTP transferase domain-containing protein [Saprospiraceae bacterium]|nr:NTP transferase domain-containing protein [Saprospiraceae bacterium]
MELKAMIFSAGLGTRLYPLTATRPKALAPFGNGTLLSYNIHFFKKQGIRSFIINTHHYAEEIEKYIEENDFFGSDIVISHEKILLDTAGGLAKIYPHIRNDKYLLTYNVDIISDININRLYKFHVESSNDISLATRNRQSSRYLLFDDSGIMTGWENVKTSEKIVRRNTFTTQRLGFSGTGIFNTELIPLIGSVEKKSLIPFFLEICSNKKIAAYDHTDDFWFDCGSMEKLKEAEEFLKNHPDEIEY